MNDKRENDEHGILGYKDTIFGQNEGVFGCASQFIIGNKPYGIYLGYSAIRLWTTYWVDHASKRIFFALCFSLLGIAQSAT